MALTRFYPARRVPQAFPPSYLRRRLLPLLPGTALALAAGATAGLGPLPVRARGELRARAGSRGGAVMQEAQRIYFDEPGLDTLTIRQVSAAARRITRIGRDYLAARVRLRLDPRGLAAHALTLVPTRGYDSFMMGFLAAGTAAGTFRGGPVHTWTWWDSGVPAPGGPALRLPPGHPVPAARRFEAPRSLGDMAADIDDLYWAMAYGQALKVTRVGEGEHRRWLVSLPGTDHMTGASTPNPADVETNIREVLNLPSSMRVGTVHAVHEAMAADGVPSERWADEPVVVCGHSQGGMVAVALASAPPGEVGLRVVGVLTEGAPARRLRLRPDVAALSVEHDEDVIPAFDGMPQRAPDQRVIVGRRLNRPRHDPLYYAHSSSTYTDTVRQLERRVGVAPWGREGEAVQRLRAYLPRPGEPVRVSLHYVWQDVLERGPGKAWDAYVAIERPDWEPNHYQTEYAPNPVVSPDLRERVDRLAEDVRVGRLSAQALPDLRRLLERLNAVAAGLAEQRTGVGRDLAQLEARVARLADAVVGEIGARGDVLRRRVGGGGATSERPQPRGPAGSDERAKG